MPTQKAHVSELKIKTVGELKELVKNSKTILISSIKGIPGSQFQEIVKKLRGKATVKVPKKNLIFRAIDQIEDGNIKKLKDEIKASTAILFSNLDSFELAAELLKNKSPSKAKLGQEAPEDIEIPEGPTDLVPGPAVSELGALGIQIQIEKGKITIKEPKVIAKKGKKISQGAANLMAKLDIKPFSIGFTPLVAFDTKENKLYTEIKINTEEALNDMGVAYWKALPFAVSIGYVTKETISFMLQKAHREASALEKLKENNNANSKKNRGIDQLTAGDSEITTEENENAPQETSETKSKRGNKNE